MKIGILKEVIERVHRGEEVDVEAALGTGDESMEKEWAEVMKEIENEELLFRSKKKRRAARAAEQEAAAAGEAVEKVVEDGKIKAETWKGAKFY